MSGSVSQSVLHAGQRAPDFELPDAPDHRTGTTQFRGRPAVIAFYPADWSPVCGDQMALYQEVMPEFERYDARAARHLRGRRLVPPGLRRATGTSRFPLLADFEPKGEVARQYGVYDEQDGTASGRCSCSTREGVVAGATSSPAGVNPGADGILRRARRTADGSDGGRS